MILLREGNSRRIQLLQNLQQLVPIAVTTAEAEFENYRQKSLNEPTSVEKDFEKAIGKIESLKLKASGKPKKK